MEPCGTEKAEGDIACSSNLLPCCRTTAGDKKSIRDSCKSSPCRLRPLVRVLCFCGSRKRRAGELEMVGGTSKPKQKVRGNFLVAFSTVLECRQFWSVKFYKNEKIGEKTSENFGEKLKEIFGGDFKGCWNVSAS